LICEVERHTYFQLPVTYRTESDYSSYATHTLLILDVQLVLTHDKEK